ncbi:MAG: SDR family NAD(P)-dependent oxidoreductase [Acetobacteraceae bacterium]|nr:SDR family NAD(P)-dependent oxidoreductase [Acetobacteraceae bacterium]
MVLGLGYTGLATAVAASGLGWSVGATTRGTANLMSGIALQPFASVSFDGVTHLLITAPPDQDGDPALRAHLPAIRAARDLRWIGYMSTTGVYGDRGGGWVDETTPPAPSSPRGARRVRAEGEWAGLGDRFAVDILRLAGIYGPGRSVFDDLRAGTARRIDKPGHAFGRIHRDDIAGAALAAMAQTPPPGVRVLNLNDDLPADSAMVVAEAARLLKMPEPPLIGFADAALSPMAASFWAENRKVSSRRTQEMLGRSWAYPTYREGLAAILAEEGRNGSGKDRQVLGP